MNIVQESIFDRDRREWVKTDHDLDTMNEADRLALFRRLLLSFDYYYEYSDDHRVYVNGSNHRRKILAVGDTLPHRVARDVWGEQFARFSNMTPWGEIPD